MITGLIRFTACMAGMVVVVDLLAVSGISSLVGQSLRNASTLVIVASTLLTVGILAPVRQPVESLVDRLFDRRASEIREALEKFAEELPKILDRETLVARLEETLEGTLKCRRSYLFVLDRRTHRLRPPVCRRVEIADLEFDPAEPLCRYLLERKRPLEVEGSPYDPKIIPIVRSALYSREILVGVSANLATARAISSRVGAEGPPARMVTSARFVPAHAMPPSPAVIAASPRARRPGAAARAGVRAGRASSCCGDRRPSPGHGRRARSAGHAWPRSTWSGGRRSGIRRSIR